MNDNTPKSTSCSFCGRVLTNGLYTEPTKQACGCVCYHMYRNLCDEHLGRKAGKSKRGPLDEEKDSTVLGINEKYYGDR